MNPAPVSVWIAAVAYVLLIVVRAGAVLLAAMTWGAVRKMEEQDEDLARRVGRCVADRRRLLLAFHLLYAFLLTLLFIAALDIASRKAEVVRGGLLYILPAAGSLLYVFASEFLGRGLSSTAGAALLIRIAALARVLSYIVFPIGITVWLAAVLRKRRGGSQETEATAEDEIRSLIEQTEQNDEDTPESAIEEDERRMIRGVFDLDVTLVREIMTPRVDVDAVSSTAGLDEIRRTIVESGHSRIPVYNGTIDQIIGIVHAKDLLDEAKIHSLRGIEALLHPPLFIPETKNIGDLLAEFQESGQQFAVVLDEYGGTAGIVTIEDILEEIVGEIRDEYDVEETEPAFQQVDADAWLVDARIAIDDLGEALNVEFPEEEDYDTLGGYITTRIGRIPSVGESFELDGFKMDIVEADPRRIHKVRIQRVESAEEEASE